MRILLIAPPYERFKGMFTPYLPLGLSSLASSLREAGHQVSIYHADKSLDTRYMGFEERMDAHHRYLDALADPRHDVWSEVAHLIETQAPDVVGLSCVSANYPSALKVASLVKEVDPHTPVVVGGPHPSALPNLCAAEPVIDFVVRGEGERLIHDVLHCIAAPASRRNGKIFSAVASGAPPKLVPLDRTVFLRPEHIRPVDYGALMSARGCPYRCDYCASFQVATGKMRYRDPDSILEEMRTAAEEFHVPTFSFLDDVFTIHPKRCRRLAAAIRDSGISLEWSMMTRLDLLDGPLVEELTAAGCRGIRVGIESASERILNLTRRRMSLESMKRAVALLRSSGIFWGAFAMIGFPDEDEEDIHKTLDFLRESEPASITLSFFTPHPGTRYFEAAQTARRFSAPMDFARYDHHSPHNYFSRRIPEHRYRRLMLRAVREIDAFNRRQDPRREAFYADWAPNAHSDPTPLAAP